MRASHLLVNCSKQFEIKVLTNKIAILKINNNIPKLIRIYLFSKLLKIILNSMISLPNYRISLKKNPTKTLSKFQSQKTLSEAKSKYKQNTSKNIQIESEKSTLHLAKQIFFDSSDKFLKKIFIQNGWNVSKSISTCFQLKWIALPKPSDFKNLRKDQLVNHFQDSYRISTKLGLYKLFSSPQNIVIGNKTQNYLNFYPRSYDLQDQFEEFEKDFQETAIHSLIKKIMVHIELEYGDNLYPIYRKITEKSCLQWEILQQFIQKCLKDKKKIFERNQTNQTQRVVINKAVFIYLLKNLVKKGEILNQKNIKYSSFLTQYSQLNPPFTNLKQHYSGAVQNIGYLTHQSSILFFQLYNYLFKNKPQFLNDGLDNIWIVKASEGSRGRSIFLCNSLSQIRSYQTGSNRIIQKYVQNLWILKETDFPNIQIQHPSLLKIIDKKFDIRFWVLVKSFCPLQAYIFSEGYLRISSQNYQIDILSNLKVHLTNFSLNHKQSQKQNDSYLLFSDFSKFLQKQFSRQKSSDLTQKIQSLVLFTLKSASVNWKKNTSDVNSFQLFGFDILLDSQLQPLLLECNMSPSCAQRGQLTQVCKQMGQQMLEIIGLKQLSILQKSQRKNRFKKLINSEDIIHLKQAQYKNASHIEYLSVEGRQINSKKLKRFDQCFDQVQKLLFLQKFLKERYSKITQSRTFHLQRPIFSSKCLLFIQTLSTLNKKFQKYWMLRFCKYLRKANRKMMKYQKQLQRV